LVILESLGLARRNHSDPGCLIVRTEEVLQHPASQLKM
jgi:hypothetical protein